MKIPQDMLPNTRHHTNTYGEVEIIKYTDACNVLIHFIDTGYECVSRAQRIREGSVKDKLSPTVCAIGYIGKGSYSRTTAPKIYRSWQDMLRRCYDKKTQSKQPTYVGCIVADEWHNFQNFAKWYEANHPKDGGPYHLDKDIKMKGNKVYSSETCILTTPAENTIAAHAKLYTFISPQGEYTEVFNLCGFCREMGLSRAGMRSVLSGKHPHHKGWTKA